MKRESRPGGNTETASKTTGSGYAKDTKTARLHGATKREMPDAWHEALSAKARREAQLLEELEELGYTIAVPCLACRRPLTNPRSRTMHLGPICRARMAVV